MTLEQRIELASEYLLTLFKLNAPKDTWNLTINGIHRVNTDGNWTIVIGGESAPYAVFTNEHNASSKNWIQETINEGMATVKSLLSDRCTEADIQTTYLKIKRINSEYDLLRELAVKRIGDLK